MRMWEIREGDSDKYRGFYKGKSGMRGYRKDPYEEAYECGYEDGYKDAMREVHSEKREY